MGGTIDYGNMVSKEICLTFSNSLQTLGYSDKKTPHIIATKPDKFIVILMMVLIV